MSWLIGRTCTIGNDLSEAVLMADPFASHPSLNMGEHNYPNDQEHGSCFRY